MPVHSEWFSYRDSQDVCRWVADRIPGGGLCWDNAVAMRVSDDEGKTLGGVVFHDWNPDAGVMCMSAAGESGWLNRSILYAMHAYVFDTAGCQLAVMQVSERNERMRRIGLAYGYTETRIPRLRGRDEAEIVMTLPEEIWRASRFHKGIPDGQEKSTRAA